MVNHSLTALASNAGSNDPKAAKWRRVLRLGATVAQTALLLRDKPRVSDYVAVGVAAASALTDLQDIFGARFSNIGAFLETLPGGVEAYEMLPMFYNDFLDEVGVVDARRVGRLDSGREIMRGVLGGEWPVYYTGAMKGNGNVEALTPLFFLRKSDLEDAYARLRSEIWRRYPSSTLALMPLGPRPCNVVGPEPLVGTNACAQIEERILAFHASGAPRSYLIHGAPGMGKSSFIHWLVARHSWRAVYLPTNTAALPVVVDKSEEVISLSAVGPIIAALRPEVIIIDDIDRVDSYEQREFLGPLTELRSEAPTIFATANNIDNLIPPLRRAGRFDDVIEMPQLDEASVRLILQEVAEPFEDFISEFAGWPAAFIVDFRQRARVLGADVALAELGELRERVAQNARPEKEDL